MNADYYGKTGLPLRSRPNPNSQHILTHRHRSPRTKFHILDRNIVFSYTQRFSTAVWQTKRYFREEGMFAFRVHSVWLRLSVLRSRALHADTYTRSRGGWNRRRRHEYRDEYIV